MLGIEPNAVPEFGYKPRTPLLGNRLDNTEIDMRLGDLLVEAKLTESDFQSAKVGLISRYRDMETVFHIEELPSMNGRHSNNQLIRGTLAAHATEGTFCVFGDARRPDLVERWYRVIKAVRQSELRCRLKLLTWQELATVLPKDLQRFIAIKYVILPA